MISLAISILWLLIGVLVLLGVLWLVFYALAQFGMVIPENIKRGVYVIILILIVIAALSLIAGGGHIQGFRFSGITSAAVAAHTTAPAAYLRGVLNG